MLARHVHMPVQSGSDRVLKRMIRRYSVAEYLERTAALTAAVPGLTLSSDVIVGFPGETDEDFQSTLDLVQRVGFTGLFGFKYSPRPHTPADKLEDDVPEHVKDQRLQALFEVESRHRQAHLEGLLGSEQRVLVEGRDGRGRLFGRTERNEIVHFDGPSGAIGRVLAVHIEAANKNSLSARLRAEPAEPAEPLGRRRLALVPP
jgi:tRNA-2-methylthio-N6-dimethylallyladenosine synthase